ncbi:hypothetical protein ASA1KI_20940 [Opitutales bacterium ASA1]|nr:hypothetical protein ASA1KI_20940 [Opitutales bacterium ASA1]
MPARSAELLPFPGSAALDGVDLAWYRQHFRGNPDPIELAAAGLSLCDELEAARACFRADPAQLTLPFSTPSLASSHRARTAEAS